MKKKLLIGVLALVMCFTLVGCGKTESNNNNNSNNNQKEKYILGSDYNFKYENI